MKITIKSCRRRDKGEEGDDLFENVKILQTNNRYSLGKSDDRDENTISS